jgi:hypothetical protein
VNQASYESQKVLKDVIVLYQNAEKEDNKTILDLRDGPEHQTHVEAH